MLVPILRSQILIYLESCKNPTYLRDRWGNRFNYFGIDNDKMKDSFIIGALFGLTTQMAIEYLRRSITDNEMNEIEKLIIDFLGDRFLS